MIPIDGSFGDGGGQILRTSLSLSLATGKAFRIDNIRAGRERPGLLRQQLTAVLAAAEGGAAEVDGALVGSKALTFSPGRIVPASIGSASEPPGAVLSCSNSYSGVDAGVGAQPRRDRRRHAQHRRASV